MVCVLHAFVYNVVDMSKIVTVLSIKPLSYVYAQVTTGQKLNLAQSANPW